MLRRGCFSLGAYEGPTRRIMACRNGRVFSVYITLRRTSSPTECTWTSIVVLDLASSSYSTIDLPDGVLNKGDTVLSRANDSGVYLVHLKELQLSMWLLRGTNGSTGDWLLVDTISLRAMCANLGVTNCTVQDGHTTVVCINVVGDNAEFAFLDMGQCILYLDVRSRALRKVYVKNEYYDSNGCWIRPYMMSWPLIFPV